MWGIVHLLTDPNAGETFKQNAITIVGWIMTIAGTLLTVYAIYIGYLFATATDAAKRSAVKKRLMTIFSSALCIYALALCLKVIDVKFIDVGGGTGSGLQGGQSNQTDGLNLVSEGYTYGDHNIVNLRTNTTPLYYCNLTTIIDIHSAGFLYQGNYIPDNNKIIVISFAFDKDHGMENCCTLVNSTKDFTNSMSLSCTTKPAPQSFASRYEVKAYKYLIDGYDVYLVPCTISFKIGDKYGVLKTWLNITDYNSNYFNVTILKTLDTTIR